MKRLIQFSLIITLILIGLTGSAFAVPTITSFTPASGTGGSLVTITGTGFTGATSVTINGVSVSSFTVNSSTQIIATVPNNATTGKISIIASGSVTSTSDFTVVPTIDNLSPSSAPKGSAVVITGTNFSGVNSVKFNGTIASFTKNSATQITATVPTRATSGKITIATSSSSTQTSNAFIILAPPTVSRFTPTKGAAGTLVTLLGGNFDNATAVLFNGVPATFTIVSSTEINATLPPTATKGKITVTNVAGSDASGSSFTVLPGIRSFTPSSGIIGSSVTIIGTALSGARSVKFNGTSSSFTENSDTSLTAVVPTRATTGSITVTTSAGTASSGGDFSVLSAITSFSPSSGIIGTSVNITGTNLTAVTGVQFNGVGATFSKRSSTLLSAIVPTGASTGFITLTTPAGTVSSTSNFTLTGTSSGISVTSFSPTSGVVGTTVILTGTGFSGVSDVLFNNVSAGFTVNSTTRITAIVPGSASNGQLTVVTSSGYALSTSNFSVTPQISNFSPTSGGTGLSVVITGSGLLGTNSIKFNGVSAGFTVNSATQVTATVPSSASTGKINLTTPSGSVTTTTDYTVVSAPTLTSFSPTRGATGSSVTIYGSNFVSPTVTVNGVAASVTVVSSSQLSVIVPATATSGAITVTTSAGSVTSSSQFTITPAITSFTPSSGLIGSSVVITGSGFGTVTNVTFNGRSSTYTVDSPTQITATVPTGTTTGPISVTTSAGSTSSTTNFTVTVPITPPTISSFSPTSGQVGTSVTINGTNFTGATAVQFNGVSATTFSLVSSTQITATVPSGANSGKIGVTTSGGTALSTASFSVTPSQALTSFSPTSGNVGTTVTIIGTNLSGVTAVLFNSVNAPTFTVLSSTQISVTVPTDASSGRVTLVSPSGNSLSTSNFSVIPAVTGFTPSSGNTGTTVVITGSGFTGATAVKFNSTTTTFTTNSANQITASVPSGAITGKIYVVTPSGTAASAGNFAITAPPSIVSFTPTHGPVGTNVVINGTYLTATDVQFNGVSASFTQVTSSQVSATVPTSATTGRITVITTGGAVTTTSNYTVTPSITSFTPSNGSVGATVIITGSGFSAVTTVAFNNKNATFTVDSPNQITTTVPAGASTGSLSVTTSAGTASGTNFYVTPNIGSFSPTTGTVGSTVFLSGSGFNTVTSVQLNGSAVTYSVNSSTSIRVTIPIGATTGLFTVTTTSGTTISSSIYTVIPPISITSFTPACVEIGNQVTITGVSFIGVTEVLIDTSFCLFTVPSSTQIIATVPATAQTGRIKIISSLGVAISATDFVPVNVPDVTSYTPLSGPVGTTVVLYGTGFCTATSLDFNGTFATFTVDSDVQITTTVPFGATTGAITVINTVGSFTTPTDFIVTPDIISFTPTSGYVGDNVTLTGTNFTGATDVSFNGVTTTFTVDSYSQITTTVPVGATTGFITVTTPDGTDASPTVYAVLPRIDSFTPTTGIVGDPVTINGSGLNSATSIQFNGTAAGYTVISEAQIDAFVPFGATTGTITVTTPVGSAVSSLMFSVEPNITGFTPVNGGVGDTVTIFGSAFTGVTDVQFNGVNATFIYDSYSQVRAIVPSNSSTGLITLTTTSGSDASTGTFTVLPRITGISPTSGVIGSTVFISGTTFTATTDVSFNGTSATFTVVSDILISATVPSGASTGTISVTTPDGTDYSATSYTVLPDVASFTPTSGEVGDPVTINGTGFTGATFVKFNGTNASFTVNSDIDISANVPNGATTGLITVVTTSGTNSSTSNFVVVPTITSFTPASGIPGTSVTIVGYAFTGATAVAFNGTNATFTVDSYGQITATVPAGATTGTITVTTPSGTATSPTSFSLEPHITSFTPSSGIIGQTITIIGTNFAGTTDVTFNGVSAVSVTIVSSTQLDVVVPVGATTGLIAVTNPDGTDISTTNFSVIPDVQSFSPTTEEIGNQTVITGTSFTGATAVNFNGTSSSFVVDNDGQITATVPVGATSGTISVTTPSGTGTSSTIFGVEPTVASFSPASGNAGASVIITGSGFSDVTAVRFNAVSASFTINSSIQITAVVPAGASTGVITVTNPALTATSGANFLIPPTITSLSASSGVIGATITINGTIFTGVTDVSFNGVSATYVVNSVTQIDADVPAGATTGTITVTNAGGTATSSTFTVLPNITSFAGTSGIVGTSVVITGSAFTGASSVKFNGTSASYTVDNSTQITATVPAGANTGSITVTTAAGVATSATNYTVTPSITGFSPSSGAVGATVTINGQAFTGATAVAFNGTSASFTVVTNTQITATVPAAATTGTISVTTPSGTGTSGSSFSVLPVISSFSPSSGVIGSVVTVTGTTLTGATAVTINGVNAPTYTVVTSTQIDVTVPASATTGLIAVTTPSGTATSATSYTVKPNITSFAGTSGPVGTSVVISGSAFTGATSVTFGGVSASYVVNTSIQITATVPAGANTGSIVVTTAGGTATSATTYSVTPSITSFSPGSGPIGTSVTINGEAFTGATAVAFNGTSAVFTVVSNIQITATVPAGTTTGTIAVTTPSGSGTSATSFTVTAVVSSFSPSSGVVGSSVIITGTGFFGVTNVRVNGVNMASFTVDSPTQITAAIPTAATSGLISVTTAGGTANSASNFSIVPSISSLGTTSGPVGTSVTINGAGFGGATSITFNGVSATFSASASPYTAITATVPAGATTGLVSVTTPGGTGTSATNFTVTPTVSSFSPSSGAIGSSVTINGQAFTGATSVTFNGTSASFSVVTNLQITATVPAGATTGTIAVTTPSGTGTSATSYTVTASISSFSPSSGIVGSSVIITGTGFFGVTNVRVNGVNMASFTVDSPTQITGVLPTAATSGLLSVTTAAGTANSASNYSIVPSITSLGTTSGPVGTSVTINGSGFGLATSITFNGVSATFSASASPYTSITATVPNGATTGLVSVTTPGGTGTSATNFTVTPTVSSFSPTSGAEGALITINGQAFTGVTGVTFNGTSATFTFVSNTQVTATVPVGATTGTIALTTPSGTGTSGSSFSVLPSISGFSPSSGVIGSVVTVNGTTLTGATSLRVNGVNVASYTVVNSTQIDLTVPALATTGLISITTPGGTANSSTSYTVLPNITSFSAASGVVGTGITLNGTAFTGATSVKFNGVSAGFSVGSSIAITTTVPTGATTGFVTVTNPNGTATSATMFIVPPTITSFGPGSGLVGDSIIITGEGFTGATSVDFNGTLAGYRIISSTSIKAAVPTGATDGNITVITPSGTAISGVAFNVLPKLAVLDNLNAMLVVDSKGFERRLFFGKVPEASLALANKYELRAAQKGIYDVRFTSADKSSNGRLVELYSSVPTSNLQYRMKIEAATYPLVVYFDRGKGQLSSVKVWSVINGNQTNPVELPKNGSFTVTDASVSELVIEIGQEVVVPKEFALEQNYPNPFNPTTTIRYALPGTYYVSLTMYNMLGEEVANLVNEQKDAGVYEFNWNAVNMPTGVYTYRIVAFDASNHSKQAFTQVKKMLLIK